MDCYGYTLVGMVPVLAEHTGHPSVGTSISDTIVSVNQANPPSHPMVDWQILTYIHPYQHYIILVHYGQIHTVADVH